MKLLIVTSVQEDLQTVSLIMEKAGINVFSVSETIGHKTEHHNYLPGNWFGKNEDGTHALFFFSFTEDKNASAAVEAVRVHNAVNKPPFPIRAIIVPVEQSSY